MDRTDDIFSRTRLLLGEETMARLKEARVILFGVGGVGSWCAEALVRSGIGQLTIVDPDIVDVSNVNRQLMATSANIGRVKVEALHDRLLEINPEVSVTAIRAAFTPGNADDFSLGAYDYVIDAIDSLRDKAALILAACDCGASFFSSMGAARKLEPGGVRVAEFWKVRGCPLAAALRKRFRHGESPRRKFLCVYDAEVLPNKGESEGRINGTLAHVTGMFGLTLAGLVISDLCQRT